VDNRFLSFVFTAPSPFLLFPSRGSTINTHHPSFRCGTAPAYKPLCTSLSFTVKAFPLFLSPPKILVLIGPFSFRAGMLLDLQCNTVCSSSTCTLSPSFLPFFFSSFERKVGPATESESLSERFTSWRVGDDASFFPLSLSMPAKNKGT